MPKPILHGFVLSKSQSWATVYGKMNIDLVFSPDLPFRTHLSPFFSWESTKPANLLKYSVRALFELSSRVLR